MSDAERVLFIHAHPDDESIDTGGTIATLIDRGAWVTVLTCTRGERGEVIPEDLKGALESLDTLAALRTSELDRAMSILGVTDHRYLGDETAHWSGGTARAYRDSGMQWGASGAEPTAEPTAQPIAEIDPTSLQGAVFGDVAADITSVILDVHPDVIVSYDANGGYGHPDHVRVREAALRAAEVCGIPYYAIDDGGALSVDITPVLSRKRQALAAYRSQLTLDGDTMVYPGGQRRPVAVVERYSLVEGEGGAPIPFSQQHPAARFIAAVLGGVIGVALGALLTVYNQFTVKIAGQEMWVGAIAATLVVAAILIGFRLAFDTRIVPAFAAAGVIVIVALFALPSPRGTQLIPQNGPGLLWEVAPVVLALAVLAWPQARRRAPGRIENQPLKGTRAS